MSEETNNRPNDQMHDPVYMRTRLRVLIREFLARSDREADPRKQMAFLHEAADLARRLRENKGISYWAPLIFAAFAMIIVVAWLASRVSRVYHYTYPDNYLRIVQNLDPCDDPTGACGKRYIVQAVVNGVPYPETEMHFKETQHFEAGHTFSHITFRYIGSEAVTDGWDIVHDGKRAMLPANCKPDYSKAPKAGHIRCEGGKARF